MDFVEGYLQGRMIRALEDNQELEDDAASARRQANEVIDKYNALVKMYYELEADRDAAYARIGEMRKDLGISKEEAYDPVDRKREEILAEKNC